jgi:hypothetical protein
MNPSVHGLRCRIIPGRGKKTSGNKRSQTAIAAITMASATLGLQSFSASAAIYNAGIFNEFNDGECTGVTDRVGGHPTRT